MTSGSDYRLGKIVQELDPLLLETERFSRYSRSRGLGTDIIPISGRLSCYALAMDKDLPVPHFKCADHVIEPRDVAGRANYMVRSQRVDRTRRGNTAVSQ